MVTNNDLRQRLGVFYIWDILRLRSDKIVITRELIKNNLSKSHKTYIRNCTGSVVEKNDLLILHCYVLYTAV